MIPEQFLSRFNPKAKILHSEFVHLRNKLAPYESMISKKDDKEVSSDGRISMDTMKFGLELQESISKNQQEVKDKLLYRFFSLSETQFNSLDISEYEAMYNHITEARPELVRFLFLPPVKATN